MKCLKTVFFLCMLFLSPVFCAEDLSENNPLTCQNESYPSMNEQELQNSHPEHDVKKSFVRMLLSLGAILILVFITFWAFRRIMRSREKQANHFSSIKILEKRTLSPKSILYLIEVQNEKVLIAESQLEVRPIQALDIEKE